MPTIHLQNGRVIDPAAGRDETADLWMIDGKIVNDPPAGASADETVDCAGKIVAPGFIDIHAHLREPGREDKETIATGTCAAAAGGFTSVCPAPNTDPIIDSQTGVKFVLSRSQTDARVNIFPIAAVTRGQKGEELTEFGDLLNAGAVAFSDNMSAIMNNQVMRRALEYSRMFDTVIMDHCEDVNLAEGGLIRSSRLSTRLGLRGWPAAAETIMVARGVDLAKFTGGRLHVRHVSTARSVELIRQAKANGVRITADATPHHLSLTVDAASGYDTDFKCMPPLGVEEDCEALVRGLADGTIDVIATDHAPHTEIEKDYMFTDAPFGVVGLETAFAVVNTALAAPGRLTMPELIAKLTVTPANLLALAKGTLAAGADADVTVIDPGVEWTVDPGAFFSKGHNCPWKGRTLTGRPVMTFVGGRAVYRDGRIVH